MISQNVSVGIQVLVGVCIEYNKRQGFGTGAGQSRVFLAPWSWSWSRLKKIQETEPEPLEKKSQELEPLKKFPAPQPWKKVVT